MTVPVSRHSGDSPNEDLALYEPAKAGSPNIALMWRAEEKKTITVKSVYFHNLSREASTDET